MRCIYLFSLLPLLAQCFTTTKIVVPSAPVVYGGSTKPIENFDPFNFNKHTNLVNTELLNSSFDDVAGCDEAKNELMEVVDF